MVVSALIASALATIGIAFKVAHAGKSTGRGAAGTMLKALASLGVIAVALTAIYTKAGSETDSLDIHSAVLLVAGLILCFIGDMAFDLKETLRGTDGEPAFLISGFVAYATGAALAFGALSTFFGKGVMSWQVCGIGIAVAAVSAFALATLGEKAMKARFGKFAIPVIAYSFVLFFVAAAGIGAWIEAGKTVERASVAGIGCALMALANLVLIKSFFGIKRGDAFLCAAYGALHYAAQICLATFAFYM